MHYPVTAVPGLHQARLSPYKLLSIEVPGLAGNDTKQFGCAYQKQNDEPGITATGLMAGSEPRCELMRPLSKPLATCRPAKKARSESDD
ncbi:hypothetical protein RRG08_058320 [Elysia crispata]|uniref:Uncharacterized protein n=1 Tax=Elysia crispata TaxID=231223 RepID=A0AAE0YVR5_9GAST|nr:hypothetical protein RRG08_058320 [Elysia crispata]